MKKATENEKKSRSAADSVALQKKNETGLPDNLKNGIENLSGMDISDVRVRRNSSEPAKVGAHAYAQGKEIHLAPGQERHLPHEAWHVVQQAQGRVKPTTSVAGRPVNDDKSLEKEADVMGAKAMQRMVSLDLPLQDSGCNCPNCLQGKFTGTKSSDTGNVIQRLNDMTAEAANEEAVGSVEKEKGGSALLSGWGSYIAGHAGHKFSDDTHEKINDIGKESGCCICHTKDPGTQSGNFVVDHEPPDSLVAGGYTGTFRFYPHCLGCSNMQAGVVSAYKSRMKKIRDANDDDWATDVEGEWFWN